MNPTAETYAAIAEQYERVATRYPAGNPAREARRIRTNTKDEEDHDA